MQSRRVYNLINMNYVRIVLFLSVLLMPALNCEARDIRIVSLAPNITEMLFAIGMGDNIVGVDNYSNYPEAALVIRKVGTFFRPNMERIILLKPDYVFAHRDMSDDEGEYLRGLGVKVKSLSPGSIEEICDSIEELGQIFGKEREADEITAEIRNRIKLLQKDIKKEKPRVFIQLFDDPLITGAAFLGDVIEAAGGTNIAWDVRKDSGMFSYELLIKRNPDIVLIAGFSDVENLPASINAVKNKRVYGNLDLDILLRPGPRVLESVEALHRIFYEED